MIAMNPIGIEPILRGCLVAQMLPAGCLVIKASKVETDSDEHASVQRQSHFKASCASITPRVRGDAIYCIQSVQSVQSKKISRAATFQYDLENATARKGGS